MPLSGKELVKMLRKDGWDMVRIKGSHHIMTKGSKTISIPVHGNQSLKKGIERKLLTLAGVKKK